MRRIHPLLICLFVLATSAGPAIAQLASPKDPKAKAENDEGNRLYKLGHFEEAIAHYEAAARISDEPVLMYNLGQANRQLGRYKKSIWFYERFLGMGNVDPEVAMYVRNFIKVMKAKLADEVRDRPPVDPEPRDSTQTTTQDGDKLATRAAAPSPATDEAKPWHDDLIGWSLAGGGVVIAGVGIGFLASASGLDDDAANQPNQTRRNHLQEQANSRRTVGAILGVTGAAVLVAGIVKLAIFPKAKGVEHDLALTVMPGGILLSGRY